MVIPETSQRDDAGVGLLIGVNMPKAMEPRQIINRQDDGPYAVQTLLGWVVNGPLCGYTSTDEAGHQRVTATTTKLQYCQSGRGSGTTIQS